MKKRESRKEAERAKLNGLDSSFPLNSLITSSHSGLGCHGNVYMTPYPAEAKTGMAHIMLNLPFTWNNPARQTVCSLLPGSQQADGRPLANGEEDPIFFCITRKNWGVVVNISYVTQFCVFVPRLSLAMKAEYRL